MPQKSVDKSVQHTNDDSVVSKRSAGKMGYIEDPYLRHFVVKPSRRSPLINRGYYLRIAAMTDLAAPILRSLAVRFDVDEHRTPLQVISLGAGFDTLAARMYGSPGFERVHWYDIDFPEVIANKVGLMIAAPLSQFPFRNAVPISNNAELVAERYAAVGLDLRQTQEKLVSLLIERSKGQFSPLAPTLVYAECVMQYMAPSVSSAIISWVASTLPNAVFVAYDQLNPRDSFGHTMTRSLESKMSPLLGIDELCDGVQLVARAQRCGLRCVRFVDFFRVSRWILSGDNLDRVERIECFDELEEWHEMCQHYGILCGSTSPDLARYVTSELYISRPRDASRAAGDEEKVSDREPLFLDLSNEAWVEPGEGSAAVGTSRSKKDSSLQTATVSEWPLGRCAIEGWGFGSVHAEVFEGSTVLVSFGGLRTAKGQSRCGDVRVHSLEHGDIPTKNASEELHDAPSSATAVYPVAPPALTFHSFTRVAPWTYVVVGGRTNPTVVSDRTFVLQIDASSLPVVAVVRWLPVTLVSGTNISGRYRHAAVALVDDFAVKSATNDRHGAAISANILVHGGRSAEGVTLSDTWLGRLSLQSNNGSFSPRCSVFWTPVSVELTAPVLPRHSHAMVSHPTVPNAAILSGGLVSLNTASAEIWTVAVNLAGTASDATAHWEKSGTAMRCPTYSHAMLTMRLSIETETSWFVVLHGGSSTEPKLEDDLRSLDFIPLNEVAPATPISSSTKEWSHEASSGRMLISAGVGPTWTRHALVPLVRNQSPPSVVELGIVGGGFTAFSFGTYTALRCVQTLPAAFSRDAVAILDPARRTTSTAEGTQKGEHGTPTAASEAISRLAPVQEVPRYTADALARQLALARAAQHRPVVLRNVPLGPCVDLWASPMDLAATRKASWDRVISVHVSKGGAPQFDFVLKNFAFRHVTLGEMLTHCFGSSSSCGGSDEYWYFRSVGNNMMTDRSDVWRDFPDLASDIQLPSDDPWRSILSSLHQSCLRVNQSGMQLWPHYDTMDNVLLQMVGKKRVVLFPPSQLGNLYVKGSSSRVVNVDRHDPRRFPRFAEALRHATVVELLPGDALFIPANWFHHITAVTACIGVNLFFRRPGLASDLLDEKDLYGNKDLPCCTALRASSVEQIMGSLRLLESSRGVPRDYCAFALRQLLQDLEDAAESLERSGDK